MKPRLLDLFCGGGGACEGYQRAGFDVTGVDLRFSPNYPGSLIVGDALEYADRYAHEFDFVHASPPCQGYSTAVVSVDSVHNHTRGKNEPRLIADVRRILLRAGIPFVIENVMGARSEMFPHSIILCGSMFGLPISRHRLFEAHGFDLFAPIHPNCHGMAKRYAVANNIDYRDMSVTGKGRNAGTSERWARFLGVRHSMTQHELAESIPPVYAQYVGRSFLEANP